VSMPRFPRPDPHPSLFSSAEKRALYCRDVYFISAWIDLQGRRSNLTTTLWPLASVIIKPDAFAARAATRVPALLAESGFRPLGAVPFRFDHHCVRESLRYILIDPDLERLAAIDAVLTAGESLYVLLRDTTEHEGPATVRLSSLKGSTRDGAPLTPDKLRARLGARGSLLNFIHVADDPGDLVREIGLLFDDSARGSLLDILCAPDTQADLATVVGRMEEAAAHHDFEWRDALVRVRHAAAVAHAPAVIKLLDRLPSPDVSWHDLHQALRHGHVRFDPWDAATVAAHLVGERVGAEEVALWEARAHATYPPA